MSRLFLLGGMGVVLLAGVPGYGAKVIHLDVPSAGVPRVEAACETAPAPPPNTTPMGSICAER